ncbi:MAG: flagellar motor protein PomA [SAR86 cluster bacterium]|uniref:Flagellar motor protein PomA n=1 Tax=SAR86 cluster bacterium TaxID=2030880 RepID=A0A2A5CBH5_9GAMM|nr:flagellar motor protein PomA [Gammaproteobacteria bacterium AH-315-E17]PCJ40861.1 MAG: flagellar motor protein PomA [SAR86 cluster bacterium]
MDLASLIGILAAFGIVFFAVLSDGNTSPMVFLNVPSILIVIVGSFAVVMMKFNLSQFIGAIKVASKAFIFKQQPAEELIQKIVEISQIAKKEGMLALDEMELENKFLSQGVQMLADGYQPEVIREVLTKDMQMTVNRHKWGAKVFKSLGDIAPAMGMIGTLIGLVQMLSNMADPQSIGPAMAVALLTTLYGAMLANMFALPVADKLELRKVEEGCLKSICIDGLLAIQEGHGARVVEGLLKVYLSPKQRDASANEKDGAKLEEVAKAA